MRLQNLLDLGVCLVDDAQGLAVDQRGGVLGIRRGAREVSAEKNAALIVPIGDGAELFAHAVVRDHAARNARRALDVVGRAGRNIADDERLGAAAAEQHDNFALHLTLGQMLMVAVRAGHRDAGSLPGGDNRNLMHGLIGADDLRRDGVACFVVCRDFLVVVRDLMRALLRSHEHAHHRVLDVVHADERLFAACGKQRRLV